MSTPTVYVIGTLLDRKIFTAQHGWVRPDDTRKIIAGFIFDIEEAKKMLEHLQSLPRGLSCLQSLAIFPVDVTLRAGAFSI